MLVQEQQHLVDINIKYRHNYINDRVLIKLTFPIIVSYSALGIGLYLFYRKNAIAQFK